jgi:hypothetical protein
MTSQEEIRDYWFNSNEQFIKNFDYEDALKICWKCTKTRPLEKCHIIPKSLNGADAPNNLVLLCKECHVQNPNVNDKEYYISWLNKTKNYCGLYGTSETIEILKEVISENINSFSVHEFNSEMLKDLFKECSTHFGHNINRESKKYILTQYFKQNSHLGIKFNTTVEAFKFLQI